MAKLQLLEAYRERHGLDWDDHRLAAVDLQYHDLRPERSLFARLDTERLVTEQDVLDGGDRAAPTYPGLFPRPVPQALGVVGGQRQLGLDGVRPGYRPPPACPDDGSATWNGRASSRSLLDGSSSPAELLARLSA